MTSRFPSYGAASKTVAINFYGLTRSLTHTHASIVKNLFEPLKQAGYEVCSPPTQDLRPGLLCARRPMPLVLYTS